MTAGLSEFKFICGDLDLAASLLSLSLSLVHSMRTVGEHCCCRLPLILILIRAILHGRRVAFIKDKGIQWR
jgi:hypothetical protein